MGQGALVTTVAACAVLAGCGSEEETVSARFVERTVYRGDDPVAGVTEGSYDWTAREGSAVETGIGLTHEVIQIEDDCYTRFGEEPWRKTSATDVDLCSAALFADPRQTLPLFRETLTGFRKVGRERVRGVETTHYRGRLDIGGATGAIELWADDDDVARKVRQSDETRDRFVEGYTRTREYFDFGVDVDVSAPDSYTEGG